MEGPMTDTVMKTCTKCGVAKGLECFHKSSNGKNGLAARCKDCRRTQRRDFYLLNAEKIRASNLAYAKANRDSINAKIRERRKDKTRAEQLREYQRAWRKSNPEKFRLERARYKARHPEKFRSLVPIVRSTRTPDQRRAAKLAASRKYDQQAAEDLSDSYILGLLKEATGAPRSAIPPVLIETHRVHLKIKRLLRQRKQA
jgi:hypothetical protein